MNVKKSFLLAALVLAVSVVPAFANSADDRDCGDVIAEHRTDLQLIKAVTGMNDVADILSVHADNLYVDLINRINAGGLSHPEAQIEFQEVQMLSICSSSALFTKYEL